MQDMVLQLPQSLKERIRSTIREEARNAHSVVAAFVIGVIISLLEAVCTGQVYAPTLYYIYRTDTSKTGVLYYLTAYNLCFILPLVIIFIFAFYGLKSESLINFMRRHTTLVKFLTALLFLLMLIFLLK